MAIHAILFRFRFGIVVGASLAFSSNPVSAQLGGGDLALRGPTIYVDAQSLPIFNGVVIIRNGRIAAIGPRSEVNIPVGMQVLELNSKTLLPGFWNSHVHFAGRFDGADTANPTRLAMALREMVTGWGFTTVFETGGTLSNTTALRARIESGAVPGPKIFTTGPILYPRGAHYGTMEIATPADAISAVDTLTEQGVDAIKVYAQAFWDLSLQLSPPVLASVVAEAHRHGLQVFAHPSNADGLRNAVNAGVDQLVHTTPQIGPWGTALVEQMKASNIALIPTLKLWQFELQRDTAGIPASIVDEFTHRGVIQLAEYFSAGGPILFGTDVGYMTDYSTLAEFMLMGEAGMGFRDILVSLTTAPIARRGLSASTGRIAVGFDADLVVLRADPAADIGAFANVLYTIRAGRIIFGPGSL